ncbi:hypothetical protein [Lactococcus lactis]|uniref:hypothetical protein n=1 Tax=Lactococcus lactis TaxID=1358 RepID=UPI0020273DE7|nr:hypothetical protein [Lactococcus lactis]MCL9638856.1 hypothetical protein [Lactococcus lactis]
MKKWLIFLFNVIAFLIGLLFLYTWFFTKNSELANKLGSLIIVLAIISSMLSFFDKRKRAKRIGKVKDKK